MGHVGLCKFPLFVVKLRRNVGGNGRWSVCLEGMVGLQELLGRAVVAVVVDAYTVTEVIVLLTLLIIFFFKISHTSYVAYFFFMLN